MYYQSSLSAFDERFSLSLSLSLLCVCLCVCVCVCVCVCGLCSFHCTHFTSGGDECSRSMRIAVASSMWWKFHLEKCCEDVCVYSRIYYYLRLRRLPAVGELSHTREVGKYPWSRRVDTYGTSLSHRISRCLSDGPRLCCHRWTLDRPRQSPRW
jgi:hypothetical protein